MSDDFFSALQQLVRAHVREVHELRQRVVGNGKSSSFDFIGFESSLSLEAQVFRDALKLSQELQPEHARVASENHPFPATSALCLSTPIVSARTPTKTPCTPRNGAVVNSKDNSHTPRLFSTPRWEEATSSTKNNSHTPSYTEGNNPSRASVEGTKVNSMLRQSETDLSAAFDQMKLGTDSLDGSINYSSEMTNAYYSETILSRWEAFTYELLSISSTARFVVHPGWAEALGDASTPTGSASVAAAPTQASRKTGVMPQNIADEILRHESHKLFLQESNGENRAVRFSGANILTKHNSKILNRKKRRKRTVKNFIVLHPQSRARQIWTIACYFVFLYEIIALTMSPFALFDSSQGRSLEFCSVCFWSCDIIMNFISGFYVKGVAETRLLVVAMQYAKTWFLFDIIVVTCQLVGLLMESVANGISATISLRLIRIACSFRLGRLIYWLRDNFGWSTSALARGKLVHLMIGLYFFVHVFACLLYAVGNMDDGWVSKYGERLIEDSEQLAAGHNYLVCLHWTLSQLQGNVDLYPGTTTTTNLSFVVISSACSIVALTLFVSSATDTFSDIRQQRQRELDEERLLREFFARHNIDPEVKHRANHYLQQKKQQQKLIDGNDNDHKALNMFPKQFQSILRTEMWASSILWHPLFAYLAKQHKSIFVKLCSDVLTLKTYEPNDDVFVAGDHSSHAHVIVRGAFVVSSTAVVSAFASVCSSSWTTGKPRMSLQSDEPKTSSAIASAKSMKSEQSRASIAIEDESPKRSVPTTISRPSSPSSPIRKSTRTTSFTSGVRSQLLHWASMNSEDTKKSTKSLDLDGVLANSKPIRKVASGQLVSEISLWMPWVHSGDLCSSEHGHCLDISTVDLINTVKSHASPFGVFAAYAQRFVEAAKYMQQNYTQSFTELMSFHHVLEVEREVARMSYTESYS